MPKFELEFSMQGRVVVEADDVDEAEQLMHDGLSNMDTSMFDEFDQDQIDTESSVELPDD